MASVLFARHAHYGYRGVQETVAAVRGHHDEVGSFLFGGIHNTVDDVAGTRDFFPLPAGISRGWGRWQPPCAPRCRAAGGRISGCREEAIPTFERLSHAGEFGPGRGDFGRQMEDGEAGPGDESSFERMLEGGQAARGKIGRMEDALEQRLGVIRILI